MLSDVYITRYINSRGQEFGFVRYVNVKNKHKHHLQALDSVWIGDCCVLACEARYHQFAHNDVVVSNTMKSEVRKEGGEVRLGVSKVGEGVKNLRKGVHGGVEEGRGSKK